jgi:predicted membrane-bound dolichyl-phosphate-mannose-protein mannosyltransferase
MEEENLKKEIVVTDLFVEIYENFNVSSQIDKMMKLSERELYLLLTLCLDKHVQEDDYNSTVSNNLRCENEYYIKEIYHLQDDKLVNNKVIKKLIKETGYKYIDTKNICDKYGNPLIEPLSKDVVRDMKIDIITEK